ncbi:hypothetical protein OAF50_01095 [bacterium]|nr:hypothetical protein [bacterium]
MKDAVGIGIDLTQEYPRLSVATCTEAVLGDGRVDPGKLAKAWPPQVKDVSQSRSIAKRLPSVVLPVYSGEPFLYADDAGRHRRGSGLKWPPEAQFPFSRDPQGSARVPLFAAWMSLLPPPGGDGGIRKAEDVEFSWNPNQTVFSLRASAAIATSIQKLLSTAGLLPLDCQVAVVVPDSLDEAGQELLLSSLGRTGLDLRRVHLLPRPLSLVVDWCSRQRQAGDKSTKEAEGEPFGKMRVLSCPVDQWEAGTIEIRSRRFRGRNWLFPVRDRVSLAGNFQGQRETLPEVSLIGLRIMMGLALENSSGDVKSIWNGLFGSDRLAKRLNSTDALSRNEMSFLEEILTTVPKKIISHYNSIQVLEQILGHLLNDTSEIRKEIESRWGNQETRLKLGNHRELGRLFGGGLSNIKKKDGTTIAEVLSPKTAFQEDGLQASTDRGAALAAAAIGAGLPCYREMLLPLDLQAEERNELGDKTMIWKPLVERTSVEAGIEWISPHPVTGMGVEVGQEKIQYVLRRSLNGDVNFKDSKTKLKDEIEKNQEVSISAYVRPGQGYAKVRVVSEEPGIIATQLDWAAMTDLDSPPEQRLAYMPGTSVIKTWQGRFWDASYYFNRAISDLQSANPEWTNLNSLSVEHLNKWQYSPETVFNPGNREVGVYHGVFNSDGNLKNLRNPELAESFIQQVEESFDELDSTGLLVRHERKLRQELIRAAGWSYLAAPENIVEYLREALESENYLFFNGEHLTAIGNCLDDPEDFRLFFSQLISALGNENLPVNHWLRAIRNLARFRNHTFHTDVISDQQIEFIFQRIFQIMHREINRGNFERIFDNCLETLLFILKRRRYREDFLDPESNYVGKVIDVLDSVDQNYRRRLSERTSGFPKITVRFLKMEATRADVIKVLSSGS